MARNTTSNAVGFNPRKKRPGVVAKTKTSNHAGSKNYKKKYRGQGR